MFLIQSPRSNAYSGVESVVRAVLTASLVPNIAIIKVANILQGNEKEFSNLISKIRIIISFRFLFFIYWLNARKSLLPIHEFKFSEKDASSVC